MAMENISIDINRNNLSTYRLKNIW